jgi:hypothetical protein
MMNSRVVVDTYNGYGFPVHNWNLIVETHHGVKNFFLGQDVKFCSRVLGMSPRYIVEQIGSNDFGNEETLEKLGNFICETLGLTEDEQVSELEPWELCCQ